MPALRHNSALPYVYRRRKLLIWTIIFGALSMLAICVCCLLGAAKLSLSEMFQVLSLHIRGQEQVNRPASVILLNIRLPRALLSYVVGAALAVSGACMQGIFKNPMAEPGLLGVSSGAALGAAVAMVFNLQSSPIGFGAVSICAFIGGILAVALVLSIARTRGRTSTIALLLSGTAVSAFLSALLSGLLTLNHEKMESVYRWTMGSFTSASWTKLQLALPVTLAGIALLRVFARDLNTMQMGEAEARMLGISTGKTRIATLTVATLITATCVSLSGVIGFVGLMAPHAVRSVTGPDHRSLIPLSALAGGLFLLIADTLARTVAVPLELPVGVLTSLFGGPFFLFLLKRSREYS